MRGFFLGITVGAWLGLLGVRLGWTATWVVVWLKSGGHL